MLISRQHRFLFIHIPKSAGISMRNALAPFVDNPSEGLLTRAKRRLGWKVRTDYNLKAHARARDIQAALSAELFRSCFKFAFVRNPWDREVSLYHYILQDSTNWFHSAVGRLKSFDQYVDWVVGHEPRLQLDYLTDEAGKLLVDFVGKFEDLRRDFAHVCRTVGIQAPLPHVNPSNHADYRTFYTPRTRRLIEAHYQPDIELWGHGFGDDRSRGRDSKLPARLRAAPRAGFRLRRQRSQCSTELF